LAIHQTLAPRLKKGYSYTSTTLTDNVTCFSVNLTFKQRQE